MSTTPAETTRPCRRWTPGEDALLRELRGTMALAFIAEELGRSLHAVAQRCVRLGITEPPTTNGRIVATNGYVMVRMPDHPNADSRGYVYEHRLVVEEDLGRPLGSDEHVHHINGDKQDNRLKNLAVLSPADHRRAHRKSGPRRGGSFLREVPCCDYHRTREVWTELSAEACAARWPRCKSCAVKRWHAVKRAAKGAVA